MNKFRKILNEEENENTLKEENVETKNVRKENIEKENIEKENKYNDPPPPSKYVYFDGCEFKLEDVEFNKNGVPFKVKIKDQDGKYFWHIIDYDYWW